MTAELFAEFSRRQRPLYFAAGDRKLFGWFHAAAPQHKRDCAVVVCNPLGYEYTHSYRSLRHLALKLADKGIACLRFDYDATGDSPGEDLAPNRLRCWLDDIRAAVATARQLSGCANICLIGLRMGATLAATIASSDEIAQLVLWGPCNGRHYVREMKALARTAASETDDAMGFEAAGFMLLHETAEQLKQIDLLKLTFRSACDVLLLQRDDMDFDSALEPHIRQCGAHIVQLEVSGYADMMAEPQFTIVPSGAIDRIVGWLLERAPSKPREELIVDLDDETGLTPETQLAPETGLTQDGVKLVEQHFRFGQHGHLFGIVTIPNDVQTRAKPAIVLLNSGSVHRVGPNRLYVTLARKLAARGFLCLRFDLQGLGDSLAIDEKTENHPYPKSATNDTAAALQFLSTQFGCASFVVGGLCSGAHTAFHAAIDLKQYNIAEAILINPLTFRYVEGMSLKTTQHFQDAAHYKKSARKIQSWLKLLRGKVSLTHLMAFSSSQLKVIFAAQIKGLRERFLPHAAPLLAKDLRALETQRRPLSLFIAKSDPGYALLMTGARYTATQLVKSKQINLKFIANGDHTFSTRGPRSQLIESILQHVNSRFG